VSNQVAALHADADGADTTADLEVRSGVALFCFCGAPGRRFACGSDRTIG
jgi:hypothetical protein